jgi:hypothetical protein
VSVRRTALLADAARARTDADNHRGREGAGELIAVADRIMDYAHTHALDDDSGLDALEAEFVAAAKEFNGPTNVALEDLADALTLGDQTVLNFGEQDATELRDLIADGRGVLGAPADQRPDVGAIGVLAGRIREAVRTANDSPAAYREALRRNVADAENLLARNPELATQLQRRIEAAREVLEDASATYRQLTAAGKALAEVVAAYVEGQRRITDALNALVEAAHVVLDRAGELGCGNNAGVKELGQLRDAAAKMLAEEGVNVTAAEEARKTMAQQVEKTKQLLASMQDLVFPPFNRTRDLEGRCTQLADRVRELSGENPLNPDLFAPLGTMEYILSGGAAQEKDVHHYVSDLKSVERDASDLEKELTGRCATLEQELAESDGRREVLEQQLNTIRSLPGIIYNFLGTEVWGDDGPPSDSDVVARLKAAADRLDAGDDIVGGDDGSSAGGQIARLGQRMAKLEEPIHGIAESVIAVVRGWSDVAYSYGIEDIISPHGEKLHRGEGSANQESDVAGIPELQAQAGDLTAGSPIDKKVAFCVKVCKTFEAWNEALAPYAREVAPPDDDASVDNAAPDDIVVNEFGNDDEVNEFDDDGDHAEGLPLMRSTQSSRVASDDDDGPPADDDDNPGELV